MIRLGTEIIPNLTNPGQTDKTTLSTTEIQNLVDTEENRALRAEETLLETINSETQRAQGAETSEATTREQNDESLQNQINNEIANRETAVTNEKLRAESAEEQLRNDLTSEVNARESAITQEVSDRNTAIANAISSLDVEDSAVTGKYVSEVSESNGKISVKRVEFSSAVVAGDANAPSGAAVYQAIQNLGTLYRIMPSVENMDALNAITGSKAGDVRNVNDTGDNYVWTGEAWDRLGGTTIVDALDGEISGSPASSKTLTAFSQVNGKVMATFSDIQISNSQAGLGNVLNAKQVAVTTQSLTHEEQATARSNIGAGTSSFSGSYTDLTNKPTIPSNTTQLTNGDGFIKTVGAPSGGGNIITEVTKSGVDSIAITKGLSSTSHVTNGGTGLITAGGVYTYLRTVFNFNSSTGVLTINTNATT